MLYESCQAIISAFLQGYRYVLCIWTQGIQPNTPQNQAQDPDKPTEDEERIKANREVKVFVRNWRL